MREMHQVVDKIKKARKKTGLNQADFARLLESSICSVVRYETGSYLVPEKYFERCKNLLKIPQHELNIFINLFKKRTVFFAGKKLIFSSEVAVA